MNVLRSKAFVCWINAHLKLEAPVTDLVMDGAEGVYLTHLVGHVTKQKIRGIKAPRNNAERNMNLEMALDMADMVGIDCGGITAEDIINLDADKVLAFVWTLISRTLVPLTNLIEQVSLLFPNDPNCVTQENVFSVWKDGHLFAELVDQKKKGLINAKAPTGSDLCDNALYLMQTHFDFKSCFDAADLKILAEIEDEPSMRVFLPFLIEAMSGRVASAAITVAEPILNTPKITISQTSTSATAPEATVAYTRSHTDVTAEEHSVQQAVAVSKLAFSRDITKEFPGNQFSSVEIDGRSTEGASNCDVCANELGDGRCFKFVLDGKTEFVHSRCFSCGAADCRRDFTTGVFYLSAKGYLACPMHYFDEMGQLCASCKTPIENLYVSACGESKFHEQHWKCHGRCGQAFKDDVSYHEVNGLPFCSSCKAYSEGTICARCQKGIADESRSEMDKLWHASCFSCSKCNQVIASGDPFEPHGGGPMHATCLAEMQDASSPTGGAYAKPAQSAAARAMALKRRSRQNVRPRTRSRTSQTLLSPEEAEEAEPNTDE